LIHCLKDAIQQRARELGFDDCRFATADPPATAPQFERWLATQYHGDMHWLARNAHKRTNPREVLADARTIISLAVTYGGPTAPSEHQAPSPRGLIARYARYKDYHDILAQRLKSLTAFVNQLGGQGTRSLWYVDTGPFLERDLAQRAGLGFIGKHTNLISRRMGNWIFLAEIITTLELPPDPPEQNRCGSCARCIAACPTAAITAPFQLDARRCISYLTIEFKGSIPVELRPAIGNRIYGCDDCLAVCPWNRFAREGRMMKEHARPDLAEPDLVELLALDEAGFKRRFAGTPILRTKRRGLLRNVCVALGNVGTRSALPALERATRDPELLIAEHARWAIDRIQNRAASLQSILKG
jgi:epoxyqueuosine reductase